MSRFALASVAGQDEAVVHASCVSIGQSGLLILGASGSGKSSLALSLIAFGARLVADDRVHLKSLDDHVMANAPERLRGVIEARGLGLLRAEPADPARVAYVLDLDRTETERLPILRETPVLKHAIPLIYAVETPHFAAMLMQLLKAGRLPQDWPFE